MTLRSGGQHTSSSALPEPAPARPIHPNWHGEMPLPSTAACRRFLRPRGWPLPGHSRPLRCRRRPLPRRPTLLPCRLLRQERFERRHRRRIVGLVGDLGNYFLIVHHPGGIDHEDGPSEDERLLDDDAERPAEALVVIVAQPHEVLESLRLLEAIQRERQIRTDEQRGHILVNPPKKPIELAGLDPADRRVDRGDHTQQEWPATFEKLISADRPPPRAGAHSG